MQGFWDCSFHIPHRHSTTFMAGPGHPANYYWRLNLACAGSSAQVRQKGALVRLEGKALPAGQWLPVKITNSADKLRVTINGQAVIDAAHDGGPPMPEEISIHVDSFRRQDAGPSTAVSKSRSAICE